MRRTHLIVTISVFSPGASRVGEADQLGFVRGEDKHRSAAENWAFAEEALVVPGYPYHLVNYSISPPNPGIL